MQQDYQDDYALPNEERRQRLLDQMPDPGQTFDPSKASPTTGITGGGGATTGPMAPSATTQPFDRSAFRDSINGAPDANAVLKQYGLTPDKAGRVTLPTGEIMDVVRGAGGGGTTGQWMGVGEMGANGQASMYAPQAPNSASGGAGGNLDQTFRTALLQAMQGANAPYDPAAPQNASQQNAYNVQRDRGAAQERAAMAERAAFTGLNSGGQGSGAFDSALQGIHEQAGQDEAAYGGQLAQQDYQAKRQDLSHALDLANAVGARTEAAALQTQLANLDQQYRYAALGENSRQFDDTKAFDWTRWQADQNRQALLDGMH